MDETKSRARFDELFQEMFEESDRGCILIGASVLDELLDKLLRQRLSPSKHAADKAVDPLFAGMGPLSSFSSKIKLAYCIGILNQWEFEDLERIRKIRNKAAHEYTAKTFTNNEIIQITKKLDGANHAVVAMRKYPSDETSPAANDAPTTEPSSAAESHTSHSRTRSMERMRFIMTVVFIAGKLDLRVTEDSLGASASQ